MEYIESKIKEMYNKVNKFYIESFRGWMLARMNIKIMCKKILLGILNSLIILIFYKFSNKQINNILNDCHKFYFPVSFGAFLSGTIVIKNNIRELIKDLVVYSIPYYLTFIVILLFYGASFKITFFIVVGQGLVAYLITTELSMLVFKSKSEERQHRILYFLVLFLSIIFCVIKEINEGISILIVLFSLAIYSTITYKIYIKNNIKKGGNYE